MSAKDYIHRTPCTERIPGTLELCNVLAEVKWQGSKPRREAHDCRAVMRDDPQRDGPNDDWADRWLCPGCGQSTSAEDCPNGCGQEAPQPAPEPPTVKRATLFDGVLDTFRTETELNGFKVKQGALL